MQNVSTVGATVRSRLSPAPAWLRVGVVAVGGFLYGYLTAKLPAPRTDATVFWLGNLAAPYLLLGFLAGAWRFRALAASAAGALATASAIAGFYNLLVVGDVTNSEMGLPPTVTARDAVLHAYGAWFRNFVLGDPGGIPWLSIAVVVGVVCGHLGYRWRRYRSRPSATAVALAFVLEPLIRLTGLEARVSGMRMGWHTWNLAVWGIQFVLGSAALVWLLRPTRARRERDSAAPAPARPGQARPR